MKAVSKNYLDNAAKRTARLCLKRYHVSRSWITILNYLNKCVVEEEIDSGTVYIDVELYKQIINDAINYAALNAKNENENAASQR